MDQVLIDKVIGEVQVSKLLAQQLRKQLEQEQDCLLVSAVHDEGIEPPQTAV